MPKTSAGLLLYRQRDNRTEVLLVHPGGPFWARKDDAAWSLPKGEFEADENPLEAAVREVREETGFVATGPFISLGSIRQSGGKTVHAFATAAEIDPATIVSNTFDLEWPPHSGQTKTFSEIDRAAWFSMDEAARKITRGQAELLQRLAAALASV